MTTRLYNISIIGENSVIPNGAIDFEDGKITAVHYETPLAHTGMHLVNGNGLYAAPGFIDIHLHGGGGVEFMNASPEQIRTGCIAHARHGVTSIVPTTLAAGDDQLLHMIHAVRKAAKITEECSILGVHLEGPFLSPLQSGAQSPDALTPPSADRWERLLSAWPDGIRMMGVAVETPGALELGDELHRRGIAASIAHSNADYAECMNAIAHGYHDVTHIYSGCSMVHRTNGFRHGGVVEAGLLEDALTVQVIADGCHLPPELLKLIYKCKGADHISIITDALFAAGCDLPEGTTLRQANGMETILEDGVMKLPDRQAFAGSIATMDRVVRNMVQLADVPLWDAITMATATPARVIGVDHFKGHLKPGYDADIVLLNQDLQVKQVISRGRPLEK